MRASTHRAGTLTLARCRCWMRQSQTTSVPPRLRCRVAAARTAPQSPNTTLSFTSQSESRIPPESEQRYKLTEAAIAAHHADEQREAVSAIGVVVDHNGPTATALPSCCVDGPCSARCVDDIELLAAWRQLLDDSEAQPLGASESDRLSSEAHFQATVRTLVWRGIPHSIRQRAWLRLLRDKMPARDMYAYYASMRDRVSRAQQQQDEQQRRRAEGGVDEWFGLSGAGGGSPLWSSFADIEKDVHRTLPSLWLFRSADGSERLRRVLLAYCVHCPLVGYCQGLNFIAGSLLLVCEGDEVAAFSLLTAMVDARSGYYSKSMAACMVDTQVLSDLCSYFEPELCALLSGHGLSLTNFCSSWLICLFCNTPLNVYDTFRVWDVLHVLGDEVLFRCGLSLLRHAHSRIAAIRSSEDLMLLFLQQLGDVQRIEPVMRHMYAEWRAEPLLGHSIAALREYHRYEITAEHSTLPAATVVRLSEQLTFSEDELQRLWQIFIRPDPWLTISTHCIQSLVHFRYSFCAAVFHPDTSALFKGRGLILPFNAHIEATGAQSVSWASVDRDESRDRMGRGASAGNALLACSSLSVAAAELFDAEPLGGPSPSTSAFYNPNDIDICSVGQDEVQLGDDDQQLLSHAHTSGSPLALSSVSSRASSSSSSCSSRSVGAHRAFLFPSSHAASPAGGGLRSLASTFVIPTAHEGTDSIFAHANSSKRSRQADYRLSSQSVGRQQQPQPQPLPQQQAQPARHNSTGPPRRSNQPHQLQSHQLEADAELSAFHAPSTSVPLSSPPMSPSSRSKRMNTAARVFAFAFSAGTANQTQHDAHSRSMKKAHNASRPRWQQLHTDNSANTTASPHPLPSSFSAHRALLSATTSLPAAAMPAYSSAMEHGRLTLQRSLLSSSLSSPNALSSPTTSPLSAPSALYSATTATFPPLNVAAELRETRQTFNSTTPLASTARDSGADNMSATTRLPSVLSQSTERPADQSTLSDGGALAPSSVPRPPRLVRPFSTPCPRPSQPSLPAGGGVPGVCGVVGGGAASSVYVCSDNVLARLFAMLDSSCRGVVDFDEFCFGVCLFKRYPRSARLRAMFAMCDVAGDGQVSRAAFTSFVGMFDRLYHGKRASDAELQSFVAAAFDKAAPSQFINCPLFEQIAPTHSAISAFFRLGAANE